MRTVLLILLSLSLSARLHAQRTCPDGTPPLGDYGLAAVDVGFLVIPRHAGTEAPVIDGVADDGLRFSSELIIRELLPGSPGERLLQAGDVIVAIDDHIITTLQGRRRITHPPIDREVRMLIRRGRSEMTVRITPVASCTNMFAPGARPRPNHDERLPFTDLARVRSEAAIGWLGIRLECVYCQEDADPYRVGLLARTRPRVLEVAPGSPAERAGVHPHDVLVRVDEFPVPSPNAAARFGTLRPGETVSLALLRDGHIVELKVTAARPPVSRE